MGSWNNDCMRLGNFCDEAGLVICETLLPHKAIHLGTLSIPNMSCVNQIDRNTCSRRLISFLQDVRAFR